MAKKYYWLKLKNDFFTSKEMKKLRKIAGGDTYTIIYLKLQLLSLQDEGALFFDGIEETFADELALVIDEEPENVQATMIFLQNCGLMEIRSDHEVMLSDVPSLIGSETDKAELMRKKRLREKNAKSITSGNNVTELLPPVTNCYTEIEKDTDKEIEIDKDTDTRERIDYQHFVDLFNQICISYPTIRSLSEARRKAIKARLKMYEEDDFVLLFNKAEASDFLKGKNDRNWTATFDWLIKDSNMAKVLDGNYDNKVSNVRSPKNRTAEQLDESYRMMKEWSES